MEIWNCTCTVYRREVRERGVRKAGHCWSHQRSGTLRLWEPGPWKSYWWRPDWEAASLPPTEELPISLKVPNLVPSKNHCVKRHLFSNHHFPRIFIWCWKCSDIFKFKNYYACKSGRKTPKQTQSFQLKTVKITISDHLLLWLPSGLLLTRNPRWRSHCGSDPGAEKSK